MIHGWPKGGLEWAFGCCFPQLCASTFFLLKGCFHSSLSFRASINEVMARQSKKADAFFFDKNIWCPLALAAIQSDLPSRVNLQRQKGQKEKSCHLACCSCWKFFFLEVFLWSSGVPLPCRRFPASSGTGPKLNQTRLKPQIQQAKTN